MYIGIYYYIPLKNNNLFIYINQINYLLAIFSIKKTMCVLYGNITKL